MAAEKSGVKNYMINVDGVQFDWEMNKGLFNYAGGDSILFWVSTAMKTFLDTIEEVSGEEAAGVVLEATGFRQGHVVGEYFKKDNIATEQALAMIRPMYASAGWGNIVINRVCEDEKQANIQIKNSWEYRINVEQGKPEPGRFIPGHFAGLLSSLFNTNMAYRIIKSELTGDDTSEFEFFPTEQSMEQNIHRLARQKEAEEIEKLEAVVEERTKELNDLVKEISSPIIPVLEDIVVVPLLGKYDEARSKELIEKTLTNLPKHKAQYLVLDLTGLDRDVSELTIEFIDKLGTGASLIGTETILVGISPEMGMAIASSDSNLSTFNCFRSLHHGILFALAQQGRQIV
ncbi:STAS domain-containing protein [Bacillus thermotolerans]|uniref:STAS domain-containing protein n=1 Tax=Bacillus thermotolerans TaxID=1221996 RepID=UPI000591BDEA|nr:STAS domain-containing protein [Bacillus thermotolerans]KKB44263.1 RsbR, positive regulator of sigma-B [Bacillus thermotolerans]